MTSGDAIATTTVWRLYDVHCTTSTSNELVCGCRRCALACPALLSPICVQEESGYFAGNLNNSLNRVSRQCAVCSAVQCTAVPLAGILYTSGDFSFSSFCFCWRHFVHSVLPCLHAHQNVVVNAWLTICAPLFLLSVVCAVCACFPSPLPSPLCVWCCDSQLEFGRQESALLSVCLLIQFWQSQAHSFGLIQLMSPNVKQCRQASWIRLMNWTYFFISNTDGIYLFITQLVALASRTL